MRSLTAALAALALSSGPIFSEDWLRFRGPNGSGVSEVDLPLQFSVEGAQWRQEVPFGHSSPIVAGGKVLITGATDSELHTIAFEESTGREVWRRSVPRLRHDEIYKGSGPSVATPTSDGASVFSFFPEFGLVAYSLDGVERWRKQLPPFDNYYGLASSPVVEGDVLILQCDQQRDPFLVAYDKKSGQELWRQERAIGESWSTPVVYRAEGENAVVIVLGTSALDGYDVRTGERTFTVSGLGYAPVASPVLDGSRLYVTAPDGGTDSPIPTTSTMFTHDADEDGTLSTAELDQVGLASSHGWLDRDGDGVVTRAEYAATEALYTTKDFGIVAIDLAAAGGPSILWREKRAVPYIATPVVHDGVLFAVKDGGILSSLDAATGEVLRRSRIEGAVESFFPSPVISGGRIYLPSSDGTLAVVSAEAEWRLLATSDLGERIDASPAIAGGKMFLRTREALLAFGAAEKGGH